MIRSLLIPAAILCAALPVAAQETHVLQHLPPEDATEMHNFWGQTQQGVALWGYYLGHNVFGDEAFGERYHTPGGGTVVGVIAHLGGTSVSNVPAKYSVHNVGTNPTQMPGAALASKSFALGSAPTDGATPHMVMFDEPVAVEDEFYVVLDLDDYSHDPLVGDTICLMSGVDGSRPASDDLFGRNVIRWHSHSPTPAWKDFLTQNFTPISIYFAIYPVMDGVAGVHDLGIPGVQANIYPVPCANDLFVDLTAQETGRMEVHLFATDGRLIRSTQHGVAPGETRLHIDTSDLATGTYVIALQMGAARHARTFLKQ